MDAKFKSLWKHKYKLVEETIERSEYDVLPNNPPDSQNDVILPGTKNPPQIIFTEYETPLTKNDESSDNAKLFQSVPTIPEELDVNPHD